MSNIILYIIQYTPMSEPQKKFMKCAKKQEL